MYQRYLQTLLLLIAMVFINTSVHAQTRTDKKLQRKITALVQGFHGQVGIYFKDLKSGRTASWNADTIFPTASMIKIPILIGTMDKINNGALQYYQSLEYKDSLLYAGSDILGSFKSGEKIELGKVIMLMLTTSDNTASLWLQSLAGTGTRINEILDSLGLTNTRVNSRTPGREANRTMYGWGQTTPHEMVMLLEKIYRGEVINKNTSDKMLRLLSRNYWDANGLSQIPPGIFTASKNGAVNQSRSETILVMAPHRPYIFSIITKDLQDESWRPSNEALTLIRKLSALLWRYQEPRSKYKVE